MITNKIITLIITAILLNFILGLLGNLIAAWFAADILHGNFSPISIVGIIFILMFALIGITIIEALRIASKNISPRSGASSNSTPQPNSSPPAKNRSISWKTLLFVLFLNILSVTGGYFAYPRINQLLYAKPAVSSIGTSKSSDWPMFGFNARHTHWDPEERTLSVTNVASLKQSWQTRTAGAINSSPVVANGIVYIGSDDDKLYAFDAMTGKVRWASSTNGPIRSSPAIANGMVYVGSTDKMVYAFSATTGKLVWNFLTNASINSSPTIANGVVYIGSDDSTLYAFNAQTGKIRWDITIKPISAIATSPAISNGLVYIGSDNKKLYAINEETGTIQWVVSTTGAIRSSPTIAPIIIHGIPTPVVFFGSGDMRLYAFDALTGKKIWDSPVTNGAIRSSPAINEMVYVGSDGKKLYALDPRTGFQIWAGPTGASILSSPTIANGVVYVGSDDKRLYAFKASGCGKISCSPLWLSDTTGGSIVSSPVVVNGMVYVGSRDGYLYAFGL